MMKKIILMISLAVALSASAQNKLDFNGRMESYRAKRLAHGLTAPVRNYFVKTAEGAAIDFESLGIALKSMRGALAIVSASPAQIEKLAENPDVVSIALESELSPMMCHVRQLTDADLLHKGVPQLDGEQFTGKGVVAGLFDTGIDVNHINFLDKDFKPRTKLVLYYPSASGLELEYPTDEAVRQFTTDNRETTHGTHVLGIMAGGYDGASRYAVQGVPGVTSQNDPGASTPYYGMAPEADIVVGCGVALNTALVKCIESTIRYAKSEGKPSVFNLSLGNNNGPHDGSDLMSQYLAELGKETVICIAAGNEGTYPISVSAEGEPLKTLVESNTDSETVSGKVEFWSHDDSEFTLHFIAQDLSGRELFRYTLDKNMKGNLENISYSDGFDKVFDGSAIISSNTDPNNNRYNVSVSLELIGTAADIFPGVIIEPSSASQKVYGFASSVLKFSARGLKGFTPGSPDNSINGLACGDNVIVVGAYTRGGGISTIDGSLYAFDGMPDEGEIAPFSSYGSTPDGRALPHVCAPGHVVVSSYSRYYFEDGHFPDYLLSALYTPGDGGMASPWGYYSGTSMATPVVAGTIALWLQADPTLNVYDIKQLISASSVKDTSTARHPARWGAGKINALNGLSALRNFDSGIWEFPGLSIGIDIKVDGRNINVTSDNASTITAALYDLSGTCLMRRSACGQLSLDGREAAPGLYLLVTELDGKRDTRKIVWP